MTSSSTDEQPLRRALELAREGVGLTSPNPCVGAVVVDAAGSVVGEGSHTYEALKHAEILALQQAGEKARGATLYLNLEPCCHQGRTGPCISAIVAAGIRRVVACNFPGCEETFETFSDGRSPDRTRCNDHAGRRPR